MDILVLNAGSSSVKYKLFDMRKREVLAAGALERIGERDSRLTHRWKTDDGRSDQRIIEDTVPDHQQALELIGTSMRDSGSLTNSGSLGAIGHRVVHGGETFREPAIVTDEVITAIRDTVPLAPLHNPANLIGIEVAREFAPQVPQIAVFDTAFHQSIPPHAYLYAIPYELYETSRIRRYGFHGISHQYVTREAARLLHRDEDSINIVSLHLGNGASITAVREGKSVDTSMGMTPLEGLVMGTRCGDLDPSVPLYLESLRDTDAERVEALLNQESGLKGICGASDMREIERLAGEGNERARLAIDMFCYRIRKYIGAYAATLGHVDAVVFTGGIGENSPQIRAQCCRDLTRLGVSLDQTRNDLQVTQNAEIQDADSGSKILVIRSDEELEIARQTMARISRTTAGHGSPGELRS